MNKKPYATPGILLVELAANDVLTISSGDTLNADGNTGYGVFRWLNV